MRTQVTSPDVPELQDPDLAHIEASWDRLSDEVRRQVDEIVRAASLDRTEGHEPGNVAPGIDRGA